VRSVPGVRLTRLVVVTAAAAVGGVLVWVLLASVTSPPTPIGAIVVGLACGYAASWAVGGGGATSAVVATVVTLAGLAAGFYYAHRLAFIELADRDGRSLTLPLRPPPDWYWYVVREGFDRWILHYPNAVAGLIVAAWVAAAGKGHDAFGPRRAAEPPDRSGH
jgi:hypothetical protein